MDNPKQKHGIESAWNHTPAEWVKRITLMIGEPYMQGWVASILAWDLSADDNPRAREARVFDSLIEQCTPDGARRFLTADLEAALTLIGYEHAGVRCAYRTDIPEGDNPNLRGAYQPLDRRWSSGTKGGYSYA